ncbi:MAG TPA: alkaline phosphatase family protein [Anaerolineales bacterium]|nr:alkaline phosphatase family protein [Anaerolineales bacterium]
MPDLTSQLLPSLYQNRIQGLDLNPGLIYPAYDGQSILNIPSSVCHWLGVPGLETPALIPQILDSIRGDFQRVILVLMDALALHRLQRWMSDNSAPVWQDLASQGLLAPITSISPSTTSAALTAFWTGRSAAQHGITGYERWMKEYGIIANTILHAPITFRNDVGSLERAGFEPEKYLPFPTLSAHLGGHGIHTYALQHQSIARSGLSKMLLKQADIHTFSTASDLWVNLRKIIEQKPLQRSYTWVYWSEVDHFSHLYGPDDERTAAEFANFSLAMQRLFLERLSPSLREQTLLILTADHGQMATPQNPRYELRWHPELMRRLHLSPTGENRLAFFYPKPGELEAVRDYLLMTWSGEFSILDSQHAAQAGLFGPGAHHPGLLDRIGDLIAVAHNDAYLWWADKDNPLFGRHGGLHPDEMLVPFLATRL